MLTPLLTIWLLCHPCICRPPPHHSSYQIYEGQREPKNWWWTKPLRHHREKK